FELLLGLKLGAVVGQLLGAALAVLAGTVGALVHRALGTGPDIFAHAAIDLVFGIGALAHRSSNFARPCAGKRVSLRQRPRPVKHQQSEVERLNRTPYLSKAYA